MRIERDRRRIFEHENPFPWPPARSAFFNKKGIDSRRPERLLLDRLLKTWVNPLEMTFQHPLKVIGQECATLQGGVFLSGTENRACGLLSSMFVRSGSRHYFMPSSCAIWRLAPRRHFRCPETTE